MNGWTEIERESPAFCSKNIPNNQLSKRKRFIKAPTVRGFSPWLTESVEAPLIRQQAGP